MSTDALIEHMRDRYVMSPTEAARALGVSRKLVYSLIARGEIHSTLIGACRRIPISEIERIAGTTPRGAA